MSKRSYQEWSFSPPWPIQHISKKKRPAVEDDLTARLPRNRSQRIDGEASTGVSFFLFSTESVESFLRSFQSMDHQLEPILHPSQAANHEP